MAVTKAATPASQGVAVFFLRMFSLLKYLTEVDIACFGVWYVLPYDRINEITGGVAFICVQVAMAPIKWQPDAGGLRFVMAHPFWERRLSF